MKTEGSCGVCRQCRERRVDDFVGRMMCEAATSDHVAFLTLTYAPRDDLADKVITPKHFQDFVRKLRRRDQTNLYRYFVAGEYGDLRGRAHFHVLLFIKGRRPVWELSRRGEAGREFPGERKKLRELLQLDPGTSWPDGQVRFHTREWPHGHVTCDWTPSERVMRYPCKYLLKNEPGTYWCSMSKKPPLGHDWLMALADRNIELGVLPESFNYYPPGTNGKKMYLMQGASRRDYLLRMIDAWEENGGDLSDLRMNEWVRNRVSKVLQDRHKNDEDEEEWIKRLVVRLDESRPDVQRIEARHRWEEYQQDVKDWRPDDGKTEEGQDGGG